ncbi:uncharacterized protein G2W53_026947 [Senna tora]|uniref:Uncharacterized protein n=1 Tax=Senna tora TaxID=362788 RepID=A0A834THV5_9FABA|nr:uncharacterized protein G2W53_026947 [Senna tora]
MPDQNEASDTRKPAKKFQCNSTCARPNLRWTTTWIAVGRRPSKINHPWVKFFSMQNLTCICSDKMIPMKQGSLPRSFKAIRVGRPAFDHVDRRPSKINESWPRTHGNLPRSFKAIRLVRGEIFDGRRRGSPSVGDAQKSITRRSRSLQRSFKAIRVGRPSVDHVDRRPSKINESWVNFFSMQNLTCIFWVKMKPRTQRNLPKSFKAIRIPRGQIFDGRRCGSPSVGDAKKSITHGSTFFLFKISRAYAQIK